MTRRLVKDGAEWRRKHSSRIVIDQFSSLIRKHKPKEEELAE